MEIYEAIKRIEDHMHVHKIGKYPHTYLGEALDLAITALKEKEKREYNPKLTLQDLHQLENKFIWWDNFGGLHCQCKKGFVVTEAGTFSFDFVLSNGSAYLHRPKVEPIENKLADAYGVDTIEFEDPKEFTEHYCHNCGSQRCEGVGTCWFEGCQHKEHLKDYEKFYGEFRKEI